MKNPMGWEVKKLGEVSSNVVDCPHSTPNHKSELTNYTCIRTTELKNGAIGWSSMKYINLKEYQTRIKRLVPKAGDIVYGREGSFGEAIIIPEKTTMFLGQRVMLFRPNYELCNSVFFGSILRSEFVYNQAVRKQADQLSGILTLRI